MGKLTRWAWAPFAAFAFWKVSVLGVVNYDPKPVPHTAVVCSKAFPAVCYNRRERRRDYFLILAAVFVALLLRHYTSVWPVL